MKKIDDMRGALRESVGDTAKPYLVSDAALDGFLDEAQDEACRRARLIVDSGTQELCELLLPAGEASVKLDPRILFIRRARLTGASRPLGRVSRKDLDKRGADWEEETGEPRGYVPDMGTAIFRPFPIPEEDTTVKLTVVRRALQPLSKCELEIGEHLAPALLAWGRYRYYSGNDMETRDAKKAREALDEFEEEFGKKSSALDEEWLRENADFLEDEGNF